ncbi:hypothetical protein [Bacteroides propionicifaciens]|uniref:hypothetical protein n=1 Tax=Bacteroides propionicifaciens TaxID=392838 RepID=UPI0004694B6C|nr:hypothetical protein [Bacteroides propionicifaciens]
MLASTLEAAQIMKPMQAIPVEHKKPITSCLPPPGYTMKIKQTIAPIILKLKNILEQMRSVASDVSLSQSSGPSSAALKEKLLGVAPQVGR